MSLDDYVTIGQGPIGVGSFGKVWRCRCKKNGQVYVMKKMDVSSEERRLISQTENEIIRQLRHPNIVQFTAAFTVGRVFHLITEYCSGGDLASEIERQRPTRRCFDEQQIVSWLIEICFGLQYLHSQNTIHRDIKPDNIFLTSAKVAKIGDFGSARLLESSELATTGVGTKLYQSPEVACGQLHSSKSDVWSLGCCVYELMTFNHAIDCGQFMENNRLRVVRKMPDNFSQQLTILTEQMLTQAPDIRPTVNDILNKPFIRARILNNLRGQVASYRTKLGTLSRSIRDVAVELKNMYRDVAIARVTLASFGVLSGAVAVVAGVATILTAGAMTPVAVGLVAGSTSAVTGISGMVAQGAKKFKEDIRVVNMTALLEQYQTETADLLDILISILDVPGLVKCDIRRALVDTIEIIPDEHKVRYQSDGRAFANALGKAAGTVGAGVTTGKSVLKVVSLANTARKGAGVVATTGKITGALGIVFGVVGVGIDIWQIVDASVDLAAQNPSEVSRRYFQLAGVIDKQANVLQRIWTPVQ